MKGFTAFTEANPAPAMVAALNKYHSAMNAVIDESNGISDKFMGDGIMVVFLSEGEDDNHPLRAVQCGIAMQHAVAEMDRDWMEESLGHLSIRVGVNSGEVISGSIGADTRMDYTVVGDTVNVASRLESNGKPGGVLISDTAHAPIKDEIEAQELEPIHVKNRTEPVKIYLIDVLQLAPV